MHLRPRPSRIPSRNTPASLWQHASNLHSGVAININASAPGRSGRHIVYTLWQASHMDQAYYLCNDVIFG